MTEAATQTATDATPTQTTDTPSVSFAESLGEDFKGNEAFKDIPDAQTLASKYVETTQTLSELQSKLPRAPESPDKYSQVEAPEGVVVHDDAIKAFNEIAHRLNIPDEARSEILNFQYGLIKSQFDTIKQQQAEGMETIKMEMGSKFDDALASANAIVQAIPEFKEIMGEADPTGEHTILKTNPKFFKLLKVLGEKIQVDKIEGQTRANSGVKRGQGGVPILNYPSMTG